jgi:integrase/recombinase XerD
MIAIQHAVATRNMSGKQAKTLSDDNVKDLLVYAECTRNPARNQIIVLLSAKAGLRAAEIANSTWEMVLDADGRIGRASSCKITPRRIVVGD